MAPNSAVQHLPKAKVLRPRTQGGASASPVKSPPDRWRRIQDSSFRTARMEPRHLVTTTTRTAALPPSLDRPRQSIAMPGWKKLFPRTCVRACFSRPFDSIRAHTAQIPGRGQSGAAKDSGRRSIAGRSGQVTPARHGHAIESRCGGGKSGAAFARAKGKGGAAVHASIHPLGTDDDEDSEDVQESPVPSLRILLRDTCWSDVIWELANSAGAPRAFQLGVH